MIGAPRRVVPTSVTLQQHAQARSIKGKSEREASLLITGQRIFGNEGGTVETPVQSRGGCCKRQRKAAVGRSAGRSGRKQALFLKDFKELSADAGFNHVDSKHRHHFQDSSHGTCCGLYTLVHLLHFITLLWWLMVGLRRELVWLLVLAMLPECTSQQAGERGGRQEFRHLGVVRIGPRGTSGNQQQRSRPNSSHIWQQHVRSWTLLRS